MRRHIAACACWISGRASPRPIARCCSASTAPTSSRSSRRRATGRVFSGTTYGSHTTLSAVYNRGKRSLCLDMKHKDGIAIARRLAKDCDVLIEGFRPGVAARLGIGYEELSRDNPGLIYLSVSAFGQSGPYSKRPGSDSVAQAFSGFVSINVGNDETPHRVGTTISDVVTGVYAFQAIATTLFARATVGTGRWIDVNLCQSTSALLGHKVAEHILEGGAPRALNVPAGSYQTTDGWMMVTLVNEPQYKRLCAAIAREDLASDPRFADFAAARGRRRCADPAIARGVSDPADGCLAGPPACRRPHRRTDPQSRRMAAQRPCRGDTGRRSASRRRASGRYTRRGRRALRASRRMTCALRLISARTATRCCWKRVSSVAPSTIWSRPARCVRPRQR